MSSTLLLTVLIPVLLLVVIGIMIRFYKAYWLISGYNTMSAEKKKKVDIESLGRFAANICFVIAAIILIAAIFMIYKQMLFAGIIFALIVPVIIYTIINVQKFDINTKKNDGKMKPGTKVMIISVIAFLLAISIGVVVLLSFSNKPAGYEVTNGSLKISGLYGETIKISAIKNLYLKDTIPGILTKTNGSALGNMMKGYFNLNGIGGAKLFLDTSKSPFIYFEKFSRIYIINCEEPDKTKELFEELKEKMK